jgi:hypothetical protein
LQGRTLLTDAVGLYAALITTACTITHGNIVILLRDSTFSVPDSNHIADIRVVQDLAQCGQVSVEVMAKFNR